MITDDELRQVVSFFLYFLSRLRVDFAQKWARNPSLPWLQILLVFPFGVAWFSPSAPTPRYIVASLIQRVSTEAHWFHKPVTRNDQRVGCDGCNKGHRSLWTSWTENSIELHIWRCLHSAGHWNLRWHWMPFSSLRMAPTVLQRADASGLHLSNGGKSLKRYLNLSKINQHQPCSAGKGFRDSGHVDKFWSQTDEPAMDATSQASVRMVVWSAVLPAILCTQCFGVAI